MAQEKQGKQQELMQQELVKQAGQFANGPMMDPTKNPEAMDAMNQMAPAMAGGMTPQQ